VEEAKSRSLVWRISSEFNCDDATIFFDLDPCAWSGVLELFSTARREFTEAGFDAGSRTRTRCDSRDASYDAAR
jgi:hypothetical protein